VNASVLPDDGKRWLSASKRIDRTVFFVPKKSCVWQITGSFQALFKTGPSKWRRNAKQAKISRVSRED